MSKGDIISSSLAGLSLLVAVFFAVQQTRLQNRVTAIEESRRREEVDARLHARVTARIKDTPDPVLVLTTTGLQKPGLLSSPSARRTRGASPYWNTRNSCR